MHGSAPWKTEETIVGLPRLLVLSVFSRFGGCHLSPPGMLGSAAWKTEETIVGLPRLLVLSAFSRIGGCHLSSFDPSELGMVSPELLTPTSELGMVSPELLELLTPRHPLPSLNNDVMVAAGVGILVLLSGEEPLPKMSTVAIVHLKCSCCFFKIRGQVKFMCSRRER